MEVLVLLLTSALFISPSSQETERSEVLRLYPKTKADVAFLVQLGRTFYELDFWTPPGTPGSCTVLVPGHIIDGVKVRIRDRGIEWKSSKPQLNGQSNVTEPEVEFGPKGRSVRHLSSDDKQGVDHRKYKLLEEIEEDLRRLKVMYPSNVDLEALPHLTHEGRKVMAVKLSGTKPSQAMTSVYTMMTLHHVTSFKFGSVGKSIRSMAMASTPQREKPVIMIEGGMHAREWITPASLLHFMDSILKGYQAGDAEAREILDKVDIHLVPLANPDGYVYSHGPGMQRYWRKNRRDNNDTCFGVDLNRNFDFHFGTDGVDHNECSEIYPGTHPFSEPETRNIRDLVKRLLPRLTGFLSVHSFGQMILVPWCFYRPNTRPEGFETLKKLAYDMTTAIGHPPSYASGTPWNILNTSISGSSIDWALYTKPGLYSLAIELRPGSYSDDQFTLPPIHIPATGGDLMAAIRVMAKAVSLRTTTVTEDNGRSGKRTAAQDNGDSGKMTSTQEDGGSGKITSKQEDGGSGKRTSAQDNGVSVEITSTQEDWFSGEITSKQEDGGSGKRTAAQETGGVGRIKAIRANGGSLLLLFLLCLCLLL